MIVMEGIDLGHDIYHAHHIFFEGVYFIRNALENRVRTIFLIFYLTSVIILFHDIVGFVLEDSNQYSKGELIT